MNKIFLVFLICAHGRIYAQFDIVIKSLFDGDSLNIIKIGDIYNLVEKKDKNQTFYEFAFDNYSFCYFPSENENLLCSGFFIVNSVKMFFSDGFGEFKPCDLDYMSFEFYYFNFNKKEYYLMTCISNGSGTSTRDIICYLFELKYNKQINYYPLWSIYGSKYCFGDYNNDGNLDFLKIRYDPTHLEDLDHFRLTLMSLDEGINFFVERPDQYIVFRRDYSNNHQLLITPLEQNWGN